MGSTVRHPPANSLAPASLGLVLRLETPKPYAPRASLRHQCLVGLPSACSKYVSTRGCCARRTDSAGLAGADHPLSACSGVYYVAVPAGAGPLLFQDPRCGITYAPVAPLAPSR